MAATPVRDIASFKVSKAPETVYYIPEFISHEEEKYLIDHVYSAPKPKWTQLSNRRLQNWGGLPHPKGMIAEKLPQWLEIYANKIAKLGVFEERVPNHVLVNEYKPQQGIMPHEDGPLFYPVVTTINLGSHSVLQFYQHSSKQDGDNQSENHGEPIFTLLLKPRSLLILKDSVYTSYLHGIAECVEDTVDDKVANLSSTENKVGEVLTRGVRISLTIRFVPKTLKMKFMFGNR